MAQAFPLTNPSTGQVRVAFSGFSWTTLFFGPFPALLRGHVLAAILMALTTMFTMGIAWFVFPFVYNAWHRNWLAKKGFGLGGAAGPGISAAASTTNNVQPIINVHVER